MLVLALVRKHLVAGGRAALRQLKLAARRMQESAFIPARSGSSCPRHKTQDARPLSGGSPENDATCVCSKTLCYPLRAAFREGGGEQPGGKTKDCPVFAVAVSRETYPTGAERLFARADILVSRETPRKVVPERKSGIPQLPAGKACRKRAAPVARLCVRRAPDFSPGRAGRNRRKALARCFPPGTEVPGSPVARRNACSCK